MKRQASCLLTLWGSGEVGCGGDVVGRLGVVVV